MLQLQKIVGVGLQSYKMDKKSIVVSKNATTQNKLIQQIRATTRKFRIVQNSVVSNFFTTKIKKERLNNE